MSDIDLSWSIIDLESSVTIENGCTDQTLNFDTDGLTLSCEASSEGGSTTESVVFNRDATAPTVTLTTPAEGAVYVLNQAVMADWNATDPTLPGSSLASSSASANNGQPINTNIAGVHSFSVTATDEAGNETTINHSYTVHSASQATEALIDEVEALDLRRGLETLLVRRLQRAQNALAQGRPNLAVRRINIFILLVNVQSGRRIDPGDAAVLIAAAQRILNAI